MFRIREKFALAESFISQYRGRQPNGARSATSRSNEPTPASSAAAKKPPPTAAPKNTGKPSAGSSKAVTPSNGTTAKASSSPGTRTRRSGPPRKCSASCGLQVPPPGRGLWMMGTDYIYERGSAALNNCAFVSTDEIQVSFSEPFCFLMDMSMLGVGVAFDTKGAARSRSANPSKAPTPTSSKIQKKAGATSSDASSTPTSASARDPRTSTTPKSAHGLAHQNVRGIAPGPGPLMESVDNVDKSSNPVSAKKSPPPTSPTS